MRMVDLIQKKRDGFTLSRGEITWMIQNYVLGHIPDEQMSAFAMAVYFQGMNAEEMTELTIQMAASGEQLNWDFLGHDALVVDKHSTGGVGDKTTLFVAPWAVACGLKMGKMSGRGLGHTGGTIDKLESIPGFRINLTPEEFYKQVQEIGMALIGQSDRITPADARLYALRDVTGTVPSIPLIASSIMSKKIAAGAQVIVLDIKVGKGAFMKTNEEALLLADAMVKIGQSLGRKTIAFLTSMEQPLGYSIGNEIEVKEAISVLSGKGPHDLEELGVTLVGALLMSAFPNLGQFEAENKARNALKNGEALRCFHQWIAAQGGDLCLFEHNEISSSDLCIYDLYSEMTGYVHSIHAEELGLSAMRLGAGRSKKSDLIDHLAGIELFVKIGDAVQGNQPIARIYAKTMNLINQEKFNIQAAIQISNKKALEPNLIITRVDDDGVHWFNN